METRINNTKNVTVEITMERVRVRCLKRVILDGARGNKGPARGYYRGESEAFRYRVARISGLGQMRNVLGPLHDREQHDQIGTHQEGKEEGEIVNVADTLPSKEFQEALAKTQANGTVVISNVGDAENGLQLVHEMLEEKTCLDDDEEMDMEAIKAHVLELGLDLDATDDLLDAYEEIGEEELMDQEDGGNLQGGEVMSSGADEMEAGAGELAKKNGSRKRLFKAPTGTAGSAKMRLASALASPRKRGAAKPGNRQGDTIRNMESNGTSNPKNGIPKP
uniref:Uncharacterized protein n=1 Tax=Brassica oleracea TaxID=3712 RepID=A0A3P6F2P9_BRAOL|nr:unnamed protein product [Brassica oleracea]